ncbi:MAG: AAA family ATPase [Pseudonocardiaceae bacterium]|nr:AAA family ATPase [Pseudonocardiaceae bacterium]
MADDQGAAGTYAATAETHSGVVVFLGDRAYKLKKPVDLGFLDFSSRQARERACRREVELNRRLAPDVYLGVADVHDAQGQPCEHAVVMRRMPAERRLSALLGEEPGQQLDDVIREVARLVAEFHAGAQRSEEISAEGRRDAVRGRWQEHFDDLERFRGEVLDDDTVAEIRRRAADFLDGRKPLFDRRIAEGRVLDGHGDLLADDIFCLDEGPRVLDCLDFDDLLRWLDGLDDISFLVMDLDYRGHPELARRLAAEYADAADDPAPAALHHHYVAYRALVRAKVDCLRHEQGAGSAAADARHHAELALGRLRAGTVRLMLVGGLPGTGKSTVSEALADRLGAVVVSSDRVRKELAGVDASTDAAAGYQQGLYSSAHTEQTYAALADRAETLLARGESVVLDASWTSAPHREVAARAASRTGSELAGLWCSVPDDIVAERIRDRSGAESDADENIAALMAADADPWPQATVISTAGPPEDSVQQALARLG